MFRSFISVTIFFTCSLVSATPALVPAAVPVVDNVIAVVLVPPAG